MKLKIFKINHFLFKLIKINKKFCVNSKYLKTFLKSKTHTH